ncbi:MAG TPA: hypothetical protein VI231_12305 [Candidatus Binatia bacterium]|jgi:hypothetical protein
METTLDSTQKQQSLFVTVVAWVFIVLAGMGTVFTALQNIMAYVVFSPEVMQKMADARPEYSPGSPFMFTILRIVMLLALLLSAFALAASIGLLKRKNWARRSIIALLVIGILWTVGGSLVQCFMFLTPVFHSQAAKDLPARFATMWITMVAIGIVTAVGFSVLFGWLIKCLVSPAIRQEFAKNAAQMSM